MRTASNSTRKAINALHAHYSYPSIARQLHLERSYWPVLSRIANGGSVSREAENDVRTALGLPELKRQSYYRPCLPQELGEVVKERGLDVERIITQYLTDNYLW